MPQRELPLLARLDGPSTVHPEMVGYCNTYRDAVRMAWQMRRVRNMTQRQLACEAGLRPQLVTDYLNKDDQPTRRDLPANSSQRLKALSATPVSANGLPRSRG